MEAMLIFAASEAAAENGGLLGSLGIDIRLLIVQAIAFLVLLWVLSKFVYPVISGMLDKREAAIREGIDAAKKAEDNAVKANDKLDKLLSDARKQASEVISSAKNEATSIVEAANDNATKQTERMIQRANTEIEKEIEAARKQLRDETIDLVSLVAKKVVGGAMTDTIDKKVISSALKDADQV